MAIASTPPIVSASLARIADELEVVDLLLEPEVVLEAPELELEEPPLLLPPLLPLLVVEPFTEVASPGRLTGACLASAWKAARVLFVEALKGKI
jgi:hypothetical protein